MLDGIGLWWKSAIIIVQLMLAATGDGNFVRRPVRRHKQDRLGCVRSAQLEDIWHLGLEGVGDLAVAWVV
jgi:hypothetical protein